METMMKIILLLVIAIGGGLVVPAMGASSPVQTCRSLPFMPDPAKELRVFISSDASNEADDAYAVAHGLLTPTFDVRGLIAAQYNTTAKMMKNDVPTMQASYQALRHLTGLMGNNVPVYKGAEQALTARPAPLSEGAQAIIKEARRDDRRPLFVLVLGPATDIAAALRAAPDIAPHLTVVWIGGMPYPKGGWEYNMANDPLAASLLFASKAPLWQVPHNVYMSMRVSLAELALRVQPQGATGAWLWQQTLDFNRWASSRLKGIPWPKSEVWVLGDNPAIGLLLDDHEYGYLEQPAPALNDDMTYKMATDSRKIRVYQQIDSRFVLEDLFAKLTLGCGPRNGKS